MNIYRKIWPLSLVIFLLMNSHLLVGQKWQANWQSGGLGGKTQFFDENTGYISSIGFGAASHGLLAKTSNGGQDWTELKFDSVNRLSTFHFLTPNYGFVCLTTQSYSQNSTTQQSIRKTTNGGLTWSRKNFNYFFPFIAIKVINEQLIYAMTPSFFLKSTNGGDSWITTLLAQPGQLYRGMAFTDANTGFILSKNKIRKTTDGGNSWQETFVQTKDDPRQFYFHNASLGFILEDSGRVSRSTDAGASWNTLGMGNNVLLNSIAFTDPMRGYMVGIRLSPDGNATGIVYRTNDGGDSWQEQFNYAQANGFLDISAPSATTAYISSAYFGVFKTTNQGQNWAVLTEFKGYNIDMHFPSSRTGYRLGLDEQKGTFLNKSTTFGKLWLPGPNLRTTTEPMLKTIWFTDSLTGYLAGAQGHIIKTTNGGQNWQSQSSGLSDTLERLCFISPTTGFAIGGLVGSGLLLRTTNAGANWLPQTLPITNKKLTDIFFVNSSTGFIAGEAGLVLKTTNSGNSWVSLNLGQTNWLNSIWFKDENIGFASGRLGTIFSTTNGGTSWNRRILDQTFVFKDLKCIGNTCHAIGYKPSIFGFDIPEYAVMYRSTNMGVGWMRIDAPWLNYYNNWGYTRYYIKSEKQAFMLSNRSFFFEYNSVGTSVFGPRITKNPLEFELYPNPSSDGSITIRHEYNGTTHIRISNVQGQIISQNILNGSQIEVKLPLGLYFIRLSNKQGSGTKKLVVY